MTFVLPPSRDFRMSPLADLQAIGQRMYREHLRELDAILRLKVEGLMGRPVTNEEISRHGLRCIWPNGDVEYRWRTGNAYVVLLVEKPMFRN
jgi:hypothetical protein